MTELKQILENSKLTARKIENNLLHPYLNTKYKPRNILGEITKTVDDYFAKGGLRAMGYAGLRGTGKSTLLWQSADYIYKNYTQNIYFFDFSDLLRYDISLWDIKDAFKKYVVKDDLCSYKEKIVLIFDEIHESPMWAKALKSLYDEFRIAFILVSGSSALLLQSTADLATRMYIQQVLPLNFSEYIKFTHSKLVPNEQTAAKLQKLLFYSENSEVLFDEFVELKPELDNFINKIDNLKSRIYDFVVYHNIIRLLLIESQSLISAQINDLVKRVIYEDVPKISNDDFKAKNIEKLLSRLAASDEVNIQSLSQTLGISQAEIHQNLDILVKAELLNVLYPYGGIDSKVNKAQKYFFMSPSVRKALLNAFMNTETDSIYAKMLEDTVVLYFKRMFRQINIVSFASVKGQKNPDFIIETLPLPIILEVGINKNSAKQIAKSKIKYKYGIILSLKAENIELLENNIVLVPMKYFLMI